MNEYPNRILPFMLGFILLPSASFTQEPELPRVAEKFEINGHTAILYAAPEPADGRPWVWYAPALKGGLSLRQRTLYYESFLKAGIAIAGYDLGEVRGSPASTKKFTAFYEAMVRRGFSPKPILLGQSRGGMMMLAWATTHPDQVGAFVGIYPVCNLASWPLARSRDATLADFGLTEEELRARLKQFNPVDNLSGLARQRVPMFIVHGDSDQAVPLEENSALLRDRYRAVGGPITVKVIEGEGHRVCPAFFECRELVDFVLRQAGVRSDTNTDQPSAPQDDSGKKKKAPLRNELYNIWPQLDGSLHIAPTGGGGFVAHRPEFRVVHSKERWIPTRQRIEVPSYPLPAWKFGKDELRKDVYQLGEEIVLTEPEISRDGDAIIWKFAHEKLDLTATITLPEDECPRIDYEVTSPVLCLAAFGRLARPSQTRSSHDSLKMLE